MNGQKYIMQEIETFVLVGNLVKSVLSARDGHWLKKIQFHPKLIWLLIF